MKKIARTVASLLTVLSLTLVPVAVHAQEAIPVDGEAAPAAEIPSTGGSEAKAPDTGIAPSNKVAQNTAVFVGGSLLGAGIGLGVISLRKKKSE